MSLEKDKSGIFCCITWDMSISPVSEIDVSKVKLGIQKKVLSVEKKPQLGDTNWHEKTELHLILITFGASFFPRETSGT